MCNRSNEAAPRLWRERKSEITRGLVRIQHYTRSGAGVKAIYRSSFKIILNPISKNMPCDTLQAERPVMLHRAVVAERQPGRFCRPVRLYIDAGAKL
jgi:hypothetical protein